MEGVEDIPGAAMHEGIQWRLGVISTVLRCNRIHQTRDRLVRRYPHGALRGYVMGERGAANEDATLKI